jgi:hypothetical protein
MLWFDLSWQPAQRDIVAIGSGRRQCRLFHEARIPVQEPAHYALIINLKTAKEIGIEVPVALLGRADDVMSATTSASGTFRTH